jgi:rifampicin phosphotransferase
LFALPATTCPEDPKNTEYGISCCLIKYCGCWRAIHVRTQSVTTPACVLSGPKDFGQMKAGDVLIDAITTPAWTPLLARAAAVVTDVSGPLSHGSIVAREYGIPAVLGTGVTTKRIRSDQLITMDGGTGVVILGNNGGPGQ